MRGESINRKIMEVIKFNCKMKVKCFGNLHYALPNQNASV